MQRVSEVMTPNVRFISPQETLRRAAQMMDELNVGALPVCEGDRLVGIVTDRDLAVRGMAAGMEANSAHVDEVMSKDVHWVYEDQSLDEVMQEMADSQIRRIPVVSNDAQRSLVGIVSLGDVATRTPGAQKKAVEDIVESISSPSQPSWSPTGATEFAGPKDRETGDTALTDDVAFTGRGGAHIPRGGSGNARRNAGVSDQDLMGSGQLPE